MIDRELGEGESEMSSPKGFSRENWGDVDTVRTNARYTDENMLMSGRTDRTMRYLDTNQ